MKDDPHYQALLKDPNYVKEYIDVEEQQTDVVISPKAKLSVGIFLAAALLVDLCWCAAGCVSFEHDGAIKPMGMAHTIEIVMLSASALIILACKPNGDTNYPGSVFHAGMRAVIGVWRSLIGRYLDERPLGRSGIDRQQPFGRICTVDLCLCLVLVGIGQQPRHPDSGNAVPNHYQTGYSCAHHYRHICRGKRLFLHSKLRSDYCRYRLRYNRLSKIGKFIFNHSFMIPGLPGMAFSLAFGLLLVQLLLIG